MTGGPLDSLPDGCLTTVLEHLDLESLLSMRCVNRRSQQLASQPTMWRELFASDFPHHTGRFRQRLATQEWPAAYQQRRRTQRRWEAGPCASTELKAHTGPVFSVESLKDPFPANAVTISGGVFGYGEVSELYQWNDSLRGLPLDWPGAAQLGGVIALSQRPGRRDVVIGGFAGCAQIVELVEANVEDMGEAELGPVAAALLPEEWLSTPRQAMHARLRACGSFYVARHTHTLAGHQGAVPGADALGDLVATSGFDGLTHVWRPSDPPVGDGAPHPPQHEPPVATLIDPLPGSGAGGAEAPAEGAPESQSVCSVVIAADCRSLATGCNDHLVRLWDIERRQVTARLTGHAGWVWCLEPHPQQPNALISAATDGAVKMWDLRVGGGGGGAVASLSVGAPTSADPTGGAISGVAVRPDGQVLATGSFDTLVSVLDLRTWRLLQSLQGHGHRVTRVSATDDGVFSASFDSTLRHWSFK